MSEDIQRTLGRIEGKQDMILARLDTKDVADTDKEKRIRSLETAKNWLWGVVAATSALGGAAGALAHKIFIGVSSGVGH